MILHWKLTLAIFNAVTTAVEAQEGDVSAYILMNVISIAAHSQICWFTMEYYCYREWRPLSIVFMFGSRQKEA
jgi:hypothetical protein